MLNSIDVDSRAKIPDGGNLVMLNYVVLDLHDERCQTGRDAPPEDGRCFPPTSVIWDIVSREIRVSTDGGRLIRPFYKLGEDGSVPEVKEGAQWHELITDGTMEYLDVEEAAFTLIAFARKNIVPGKTVYMEIHPSLVLGVLASCIPFPDHNQSPETVTNRLWKTGRRTSYASSATAWILVFTSWIGQRPSRAAKWQT
jgi:hypothetical protein